jgi:phosphatidylglycerol---prolipoprotein diacylglyceryl transferase
MLPYLFQIGPWRVPTHDFFVLAGVFVAALIFFSEARRRRMLDERLVGVVAGTLFCGAIGARLSTLGMYLEVAPEPTPLGILIEGGKSILGGLAGAYLGAILFKRVMGFKERTGDLFAPAVALGMAVGRIGCLLTEQIGTPTNLPWAFTLKTDLSQSVPNCAYCLPGASLHPSFLYEIVFHLIMFAVLWWGLRPRMFVRGELLQIYLLAYALFRFAVEYVRGNQVVWEGLSRSQIFLIPSTALLVFYFIRQWRRGTYSMPSPPVPIEERRSL